MSGELDPRIIDQTLYAGYAVPAAVTLEAVAPQQAAVEVARLSFIRRAVLAGAATIAALGVYEAAHPADAGASVAAIESSTSGEVPSLAQAVENCNGFKDENVTSNSHSYNSDAALKKASDILGGKKLDKNNATELLYGQFEKNGSITRDSNALAAVMAAIVVPSKQGVSITPSESSGTNVDYDYVGTINEQLGKIKQGGGKSACKDALKVMIQDGDFNGSWAQHGDKVLLLKPIRDKNNNIINWQAVNIVLGKKVVLAGVEFKARNKGAEGYPSVLEAAGGELYIKGVVVEQGPTVTVTGTSGKTQVVTGPIGKTPNVTTSSSSSTKSSGGGKTPTTQPAGTITTQPSSKTPTTQPGTITTVPGNTTTTQPNTITTVPGNTTTTQPNTTTTQPNTTTTSPPTTTSTTSTPTTLPKGVTPTTNPGWGGS